MSTVVRSIAAATFAALSLVAVEETASAMPGVQSYGKEFTKTLDHDDFGANLGFYSKAEAIDYAQTCAYSDPVARCKSGAFALFPAVCKAIWTAQHNYYCGKGQTMGYSASGRASVDVTMFGKGFDLFELSGGAYAEPESTTASYGIWILGKKIRGGSASEITMDIPIAERTLASAEATFELGPVPITVSAEATGSLGIELAMHAGTTTLGGRARPHAGVDGVFSAGVGVKGASVGVYGELLLVEVSTPANASITYLGNKKFGYDTTLDLQVDTLNGSVGLYGEFMSWRKQWELFSWNGYQTTMPLGRQHGTFAF